MLSLLEIIAKTIDGVMNVGNALAVVEAVDDLGKAKTKTAKRLTIIFGTIMAGSGIAYFAMPPHYSILPLALFIVSAVIFFIFSITWMIKSHPIPQE